MNIHRVKYYAIIVTIVMCLILLGIDKIWICDSILKKQVINILMAIQSAAILILLWEFVAKKAFAEEIIQTVNISKNLSTSGIDCVNINFLEINWFELLDNTKELKLAVSYGGTWRQTYRNHLNEIASNSKLTVYLPNFENDLVLSSLAFRFKTDTDSIKNKIISGASFFSELGANVFLYDGVFTSSYYLLDNKSVMSVYNHQSKQGTVPAFIANNTGKLYEFVKKELQDIESQSKKYEVSSDEE